MFDCPYLSKNLAGGVPRHAPFRRDCRFAATCSIEAEVSQAWDWFEGCLARLRCFGRGVGVGAGLEGGLDAGQVMIGRAPAGRDGVSLARVSSVMRFVGSVGRLSTALHTFSSIVRLVVAGIA